MRRRWWMFALAAVALVAVVVGVRAATSGKPRVQYVAEPVKREEIVAAVTATGTLSALVTVQVGSQVSGRIQALYADFNSAVHRGELLAKIDPQLFQAAVAQAKANLLAAQGKLVKARAAADNADLQWRRAQSLYAAALMARQDYDTARATDASARADITAAEGQVAQTRAALHQAEVNLGYTNIVSPVNGTVIQRSVDVGQTVAASFQSPVLFTIAEDLHKMQVDTNVAESDVGHVHDAMAATFTVDAYPGRTFRGVVRQVRNAPQTQQNVVTYDAVIDVDNQDLALRPGMTANVTFVWADVKDALAVPNAAFLWHPATVPVGSDQRSVWTVRDGSVERVMVTIGVTNGTSTEVRGDSLREGDRVVVDASGGEGGAPGAGSARPGFRVL